MIVHAKRADEIVASRQVEERVDAGVGAEEHVADGIGVEVESRHIAGVVDGEHLGVGAARRVDGGDSAVDVDEAVRQLAVVGIFIGPRHLAGTVDRNRVRLVRAGERHCREGAAGASDEAGVDVGFGGADNRAGRILRQRLGEEAIARRRVELREGRGGGDETVRRGAGGLKVSGDGLAVGADAGDRVAVAGGVGRVQRGERAVVVDEERLAGVADEDEAAEIARRVHGLGEYHPVLRSGRERKVGVVRRQNDRDEAAVLQHVPTCRHSPGPGRRR